MVSCRQSRKLLECIEDSFLSQKIGNPTRVNAIMDLLVTSASELTGDVKVGGSQGCSDHALVEFSVMRAKCQVKSKSGPRILGKQNSSSSRSQLIGRPYFPKLPSGTTEQNRTGRSLRTLSTERKSSRSPSVKNQARKARDC